MKWLKLLPITLLCIPWVIWTNELFLQQRPWPRETVDTMAQLYYLAIPTTLTLIALILVTITWPYKKRYLLTLTPILLAQGWLNIITFGGWCCST